MAADPALDIDIPDEDYFDPFFGNAVATHGVRITPKQPFIKLTMAKTDDVDVSAEGYDADDYTEMEIISVNDPAGNALFNGSDGAFDDPDEEKEGKQLMNVTSKHSMVVTIS